MNSIVYLVFRNMRRPLLTLLLAYSISVLGLVLIPGQDASGQPWQMSFFHAFYFVSFMATTIGFGEIPFAFTDTQRLWVIFSLYATVISWIYAIGTLLSLIRGEAFQHALRERRFAKKVEHLSEPFFLVNGYGSVGSELVSALTDRHQRVVAIDIDKSRTSLLSLQNLREDVPAFTGDAADPENLVRAGLEHPKCAGMVALTSSNEVNLKIALTSKLLRPEMKVICRADSEEIEANMESFGTDYIVDPFHTFAMHLSIALQSPGLHLMREWLTGLSHAPLTGPIYPPQNGTWILCGYGRFGKAVYDHLTKEGLDVIVIEATPEKTGTPEPGCVVGKGTEATTLMEAGVDNAVGLVAGTDDDVNNLSIIMTAKVINPKLFVILRQNRRRNQSIADAVHADIVMQPSHIIANRIRVLLATPMLHELLELSKFQDDQWACELVSRIIAVSNQEVPDVWQVELDKESAPSLVHGIESGHRVTVGDLLRNPRDREKKLPAILLLLVHNGTKILLPDKEQKLLPGDHLLWCGHYHVRERMEWMLRSPVAYEYLMTGDVAPRSWIWRRLSKVSDHRNGYK